VSDSSETLKILECARASLLSNSVGSADFRHIDIDIDLLEFVPKRAFDISPMGKSGVALLLKWGGASWFKRLTHVFAGPKERHLFLGHRDLRVSPQTIADP